MSTSALGLDRQPKSQRLAGHFHTVAPVLRHRMRPLEAPPSKPWSHVIETDAGALTLRGALSPAPEDGFADRIVLLVHGLGGCTESHYMVQTARAAHDLGLTCLRLNLRGADRQPSDFYHAGLSGDLAQILACEALAGYRRIDVMGFSLGGHLTLKLATEVDDPRVGALAAVCSPVDLARTVVDFDALPRYPYREYILAGIRDMFAQVIEGRDLPGGVDPERVARVRTLRAFDEVTVVPRFGFADADDYYRTQSVAHRLHDLKRPALLLSAEHDPMISAASVRDGLAAAGDHDLRVVWSGQGGHVGFAPDLDLRAELGLPAGAPLGFPGQVLSWLLRQS